MHANNKSCLFIIFRILFHIEFLTILNINSLLQRHFHLLSAKCIDLTVFHAIQANSLYAGRIDGRIVPVSDDVAMGSTWLVHQDGTKFRIWTKDMLKNIEIESQNPQAKKAVLKLITTGDRTEKCVAAKSAELEEAVSRWFAKEEDAENLTFGQM